MSTACFVLAHGDTTENADETFTARTTYAGQQRVTRGCWTVRGADTGPTAELHSIHCLPQLHGPYLPPRLQGPL